MIVIFAGIVTRDPQDPYVKPVVSIHYSTVDVVILFINVQNSRYPPIGHKWWLKEYSNKIIPVMKVLNFMHRLYSTMHWPWGE